MAVVMSVKSGSHVSFLLRSECSKTPKIERSFENPMTSRTVPQMRIPPIVGVPFFFS